jgi:hypothetical protein
MDQKMPIKNTRNIDFKFENGHIIPFTVEYSCIHCEGVSLIIIIEPTEKATLPEVEFCPFCGMSNEYPKEIEEDE